MTTLAANLPRAFGQGVINAMGVIATDIIYEGAAVGDNAAGYARPLVSGDRFLGFALSIADNAAGSAGDINVNLRTVGLVELAVANAAITDVGRPVYASDDATFNITGIGSYIGRIHRFVSTGVVVVAFDADSPRRR